MKFSVCLIVFTKLIGALSSSAQSALWEMAPVSVNPAASVGRSWPAISLLNRHASGDGITLKNYNLAAGCSFSHRSSGRRFGSLTVIIDNRLAGRPRIFRASDLSVSLAADVTIARNQLIRFGLQPAITTLSASIDHLTTGSQWIAREFRFDPSAASGEVIQFDNARSLSINSGLAWYSGGDAGMASWFTGVSVYHLNTSYLWGRDGASVQWRLQTAGYVYRSRRFGARVSLLSEFDRTSFASFLACTGRWSIGNDNPLDILNDGAFLLAARYTLSHQAGFGVMLEQGGFALGITYDFPVLAFAKAPSPFGNSFGFTISFSGTKGSRKTWRGDQETSPPRRRIEFPVVETAVSPRDNDLARIASDIAKYAGTTVRSVKYELDRDFRFSPGLAVLPPGANEFLDDLAALLRQNPDYRLELTGHTDDTGDPLANVALSLARAKAVADYLVVAGVSPARIRSHGVGSSQPVVPNDSPSNRARNRRVQLLIYLEP